MEKPVQQSPLKKRYFDMSLNVSPRYDQVTLKADTDTAKR